MKKKKIIKLMGVECMAYLTNRWAVLPWINDPPKDMGAEMRIYLGYYWKHSSLAYFIAKGLSPVYEKKKVI